MVIKKLKIYFACSIRGEQGGKDNKRLIVNSLKKLGHDIPSEIFVEMDLNQNSLKEMRSQEVYDRDMVWLKEADLIVADVSKTSMGVGYEIGYKIGSGGKVLALCDVQTAEKVSHMIQGCTESNFKLKIWKDATELENILKKELKKYA